MGSVVDAIVYGSDEWKRITQKTSGSEAGAESFEDTLLSVSDENSEGLVADADTQDAGSADHSMTTGTTSKAESKAAARAQQGAETLEEFLKYAKMSPVERVRYDYLKSRGLTEEDLAKLPADERKQIEDEIKKLIKEKLGIDPDASATSAGSAAC